MNTLTLILRMAGRETWQLLPYVVLGVLASEALRFTPVSSWLERGCRRQPALAIPAAAILGIVSPLCTYGTVPLVLNLLRAGVPVAPLVTFLSASSLMNPQLLIITWGGLGAKMAIVRVTAVFGLALVLGGILHIIPTRWVVRPELREQTATANKPRRSFHLKTFLASVYKTLEFVGFYVMLGIIMGSAIEVLVPGRWIMAAFGTGGWFQILLAAILGVPLYACGGGVIPLVQSLVASGMAPGAALAFLIAGPATRIPPLMALATVARPLLVAGYIAFLIVYSVLAGLLYGLL
jgi:uncharacterized protein